jgi:hypothetical protein
VGKGLNWYSIKANIVEREIHMTMTFKKSAGKDAKPRKNPAKKKAKKRNFSESRDLREDRGTRQSKLGKTKNPSKR